MSFYQFNDNDIELLYFDTAGGKNAHDAANDAAKRFINLVDELYEKNVNFIASSAFDIAQYYTGKRLSELFKRTESRLLEMLTTNYISRPHLGFKADD